MPRYLIESHHTAEDCEHVISLFVYHGYLNHFDWGCKDDIHTGWAIIEAEDKKQAIMSVPPLLRNKARVIRLSHFDPEKTKAYHEKKKQEQEAKK